MSELLRLRKWLGINDAIRYAKHLGLQAEKRDFFQAYTEFHYPLRLSNAEGRLYRFVPTQKGSGYPRSLWMTWSDERSQWENQDGVVVSAGILADIPGKWHQTNYSPLEVVWINDDIAFDDEPIDVTVAYIENQELGIGGPDFKALTWGDIAGDYSGNALELSRAHIETLVSKALGQAAPPEQATTPEAPAPTPDYLTETHESYPPELHTAVLLWEGLYLRNEKSPHHQHTQAAKAWLEKNANNLPTASMANAASAALIDRLTTITAPAAKKPKK